MGSLKQSGTTTLSSKTKYICASYHLLRELVAWNKIIVSDVKTADQLADIFTRFSDPNHKAMLDNITRAFRGS